MMVSAAYVVAAILALVISSYILTPAAKLYRFVLKAERKRAKLIVKHIRIGETSLEYSRGGKGMPLLLLHGFGADKDNWNRIAPYLTRHYDVIALDLPGFGNSSKDISAQYGVAEQVERLHEFTQALGLRRLHIAGNSMGGYIAGNYAAQFPEQIESLWLLNPLGIVHSELSEMFTSLKKGERPIVLARNKEEFKQLFQFLFVHPPFLPGKIVHYLGEQAELNANLNSKIFQHIHRMDKGSPNFEAPLDNVLEGYSGPLLVTWGEKDRVLHSSGAQALKNTVPQATISMMKEVGHLPMLERPKQTADAFNAFIYRANTH
jgi:pimeloyl-ACP methyl ester carboxylesterase